LDIPADRNRFTKPPVFPIPDQIFFVVDPIRVAPICVGRPKIVTMTGPTVDTYTLVAHADLSGIIRSIDPPAGTSRPRRGSR
jgi:hypothetical protein